MKQEAAQKSGSKPKKLAALAEQKMQASQSTGPRLSTIGQILCDALNRDRLTSTCVPSLQGMIFDASQAIARSPDANLQATVKVIVCQLGNILDAIQKLTDFWSECRLIDSQSTLWAPEEYGLFSGEMNSYYSAGIPVQLECCAMATARTASAVSIITQSLRIKQDRGFCGSGPIENPEPVDGDRPEALQFMLDQVESLSQAVHRLCIEARGYSLVGPHVYLESDVPYLGIGATSYLADTPADYDAVQEDVANFLSAAGPVAHTLSSILGHLFVSLSLIRWLEDSTGYLRVDTTGAGDFGSV